MNAWLDSILRVFLALAAAAFGFYSAILLFGCGPPRPLSWTVGVLAINALAILGWRFVQGRKGGLFFSTGAVAIGYVAGACLGMLAP
ncbi:MAG: hypothetical protein QM765_10095 [Myxococcales bacterium]